MKRKIQFKRCCIAVFLLCAAVFAVTGCGKKTAVPVLNYTVTDDGKVHITGLTDKGKTAEKITIPSEIDGKAVEAVDSGAFMAAGNLKEVVFEEGVTHISENAFYNCVNLENITFPSTLKTVGTNIVKNTKWEAQKFNESDIIVINDILVSAKESIEKCEIPDGVRLIASGAFYCNTSLKEVTFPDSLRTIESYAFSGCIALEEIKLPNELYTVGYGAFSGCENLTVTCPNSVKNIGVDAFLNVKELINE